ncbi:MULTISPECIES: lipopolysaccharide assembly protein LapB [unclassified Ruegeria]|uniref:tetratricopeptide repeat protein n=1 Tax=unclassified Ruegeria TaxID=2625375 RepID=UPI00148937D8|nr:MULTISPECIES: tetratricopeptide repeat protein [unclassified Ruegeria]NOD46838.1 tetratricopeptide repeat protein [Ruegeria sp. HKCCD5849]NOD51161.1 tetratricopeptide repeat protein [Ruegeria sp. HKCCD5851]NOD67980.1 tetratricopeptide repeat protein [Ruegeria sp. HKCCD7303]NOE33596.1 tetratricopeptide repeat protein [Ruegeria sp. HKCCD7318]
MRQQFLIPTVIISGLILSACAKETEEEKVERTFQEVNVIDETNLNDVLLNAADPNEAVTYFQGAALKNPDRIDLQRGLAISLGRAKRTTEAAAAWKRVTTMKGTNAADRVEYADALVRSGDWTKAKSVLDTVPPTFETFKRYRLEAVVADSRKEWKRADHFYETAVGLTTRPGSVMNNWGYSKLTRGEYAEAERLFTDAIRQDSSLFTAKNNLVLARSAQGNYSLPVVPMTQIERARLLNTMAISAVKQGDVTTAKNLFREAIATHPQHFDEAVRSLRALEGA